MQDFMKVIQTICLIVSASLILIGCGTKTPSAVVEATLVEIAQGENSDLTRYFLDTLPTEKTETSELTVEQQLQNFYFLKFSGKVLSEAIDGENASVTVEITSLNISEIILSTIEAAVRAALNRKEITDKEMNQIMLEKIQAAQMQTRTGNIALKNVDGEWKIDTASADFTTVIFGEIDLGN